MNLVLQPPDLTAEDWEAAYAQLDDPPFGSDDPDGLKWAAEQKRLGEQAAMTAAAEQMLLYRDTVRLADRLEKERSGAGNSWKFVDTSELYDTEQEVPTVGSFLLGETSNGGGVFYAGKVNSIHGPSESGKTMILLYVAAQEIRADRHVVMVDFEDDAKSIINRLRHVFGLTKEQIDTQFHYMQPETAFEEDGYREISEVQNLSLCIIDAATESMSVAGLDGRNENEVALWYNTFPKRVAKLGCAVAVVDHTGQENFERAIGSQHKKSAINGVSYTAEPVAQLVKGGKGQLRLKISKDKPGGIRPDSLPQGEGKQFWRGDFKIDSRNHGMPPIVELFGVDPKLLNGGPGDSESAARDVVAPQLPPRALGPILTAVADDGEWMTTTDIGKATGATAEQKDRIRTYSNRLVVIGMVEKKSFSGVVKYKITPSGIHSAGAWVAHEKSLREGAQGRLE